MWNRQAFMMAVLVAGIAGAGYASQHDRAPRSVRLEFQGTVDLTGLSIWPFISGPFGGFGDSVRTRPEVRAYELRAWHAGQAANSLKAIIYCPGRRFFLVSEAGFGDGPTKTVSVQLEPLGSIPLAGRIVGAESSFSRALRVDVTYLAFWGHSFYRVHDSGTRSFAVASTQLKPDGSFVVTVPDFAQDPVVAGYPEWERGWFKVVVREQATGNTVFLLTAPDNEVGLVPIAKAYPRELLFTVAR